MLKIINLCKRYNDQIILNNISTEINFGEISLFIGKSGVGKSTLLRILSNLETKDDGTIHLDNTQLNPLDVGMVFQNYHLFEHLTCEKNITLALQKRLKKSKKEAVLISNHLLEKYRLKDKAHRYVIDLSGGEKQRLAIARSLALNPKIICLDEPTSALDPTLTSHIAQIIYELGSNHIVLIASHDTELIKQLWFRKANCTINLIDHGILIESVKLSNYFSNISKFHKIYNFLSGEHN